MRARILGFHREMMLKRLTLQHVCQKEIMFRREYFDDVAGTKINIIMTKKNPQDTIPLDTYNEVAYPRTFHKYMTYDVFTFAYVEKNIIFLYFRKKYWKSKLRQLSQLYFLTLITKFVADIHCLL